MGAGKEKAVSYLIQLNKACVNDHVTREEGKDRLSWRR